MNEDGAKTGAGELRARLRALEGLFEREMRARGFDPAQAATTALPSALAALYAEVEEVRAELEGLPGGEV
jgi:hypothetical protein